ncbi:hypothetical protein [Myroides injenensis]|uniref:hypothetical protein n=1 Tax=Myroides injenensis TaxID=1183151 RepID=UPI00028A40AD|nr:hypothetical protein [Myroides injenensis]
MNKDLEIEKYPYNISKLEKLTVCSNILIGGGDLVKIENFVPLVIGNGQVPKIWLTIKLANNIIQIVKENYSENKQIKIVTDNTQREIRIYAENQNLISAKIIRDNECVVNQLDLRPIGLNIFGNEKELNIANSKLSGNSFTGPKFLIGID